MIRLKHVDKNVFQFRASVPRYSAQIAESYFEKGLVASESRKNAEAAKWYRKALQCDRQHAGSWHNLGSFYFNRSNFRRAEKCYRAALKYDPGNFHSWYGLGTCLDELHKLEPAVEAYKQALRMWPAYSDAHYCLAMTYEKLNQLLAALKHYLLCLRFCSSADSAYSIFSRERVGALKEQLIISTPCNGTNEEFLTRANVIPGN